MSSVGTVMPRPDRYRLSLTRRSRRSGCTLVRWRPNQGLSADHSSAPLSAAPIATPSSWQASRRQTMLAVSFPFDQTAVMKTTTIHCNRCGDVILEGHSIIEAKHGQLATQHDEPIDLCASCVDRFSDWLKSGRQNGLPTVGAVPVGIVRELDAITR